MEKPTDEKRRALLRSYARYSGMGFQMIAIIGAFAFGGVKLDEYVKGEHPWFTILGCLLGIALSFYFIIKQLQE
ncbi:AtpZ/AtpI family protein [Solitalea sp. MAHUQ-68]|uniref:AtpZ/AtpI family protein n=1 Tax=Solitalea agri TaxID=2953739 RepID=A0A9X2F3F2_9SPHI|nr:AtpZ/AtpI family protein [Solitalea agri]MCO4293509.1 AtpZ/AtpI family protein [Solitalea agri]